MQRVAGRQFGAKPASPSSSPVPTVVSRTVSLDAAREQTLVVNGSADLA